jgi:CheY-like chemotaxis protein
MAELVQVRPQGISIKEVSGMALSSVMTSDTGGITGGPMSQSQGTVLVVDNDPLVLELVSRSLSREGYRVATALRGDEGLRLARELRPAAILLDVVMPGMDGWAVLTALKADPDLSATPVVMLTMVDDRNKGFALGASDYQVKPIDRNRLAAILRKFKERRSPRSVLIVEDDAANREILARWVRQEGWSAVDVDNGQVALERVAQSPPDLILLDLLMPVMDGFAFIRELHKTEAFRRIPIVVLTAKELGKEDRLELSGSVGKILQKGSYNRDVVLREIRELVGHSSKQK